MNVHRYRREPRRDRVSLKHSQVFRQLRASGRIEPPPLLMQHVDEQSLDRMRPGDLFLLNESEGFSNLVASAFLAVLACPACGTLFLLTAAEYFGVAPVICQSKLCSCRFRIDDCLRLVYLPAN